jgi:diguanylate cyclase (GGDEF)-like protein/PAS domain S-box-containing protein
MQQVEPIAYNKSDSESINRDVRLYRRLCLVAAILAPLFGIVINFTHPDVPDLSAGERLFSSLIFLFILTLSYTSKFIRKNIIYFMNLLFYIASFEAIYVAYLNNFTADFSMGLLMIIFTVNLCFKKGSHLALFNFSNIILIAVLLSKVTNPQINPFLYSSNLITMSIISYIILNHRLRKEVKILAGEDLMKTIFNEAVDALFLVEPDTKKIITCNKRAIEIFAKGDKTKLFNTNIRNIQKNGFTNDFKMDYLNQHETLNVELEYNTPDNKEFWGDLAVKEVSLSGEALLLIRISDIDARKRTEEKLHKSQIFIQKIADSTPNIIYIFDIIEQKVVYSNQKIDKALGYPADYVESNSEKFLQSIIHPDDLEKYQDHIKKYPDLQDNEIIETEFRVKDAYGQLHWFASRSAIFSKTVDGLNKEIIATAQDITERKQTEQDSLRLASFPRRNPNPILECNFEGKITYINPSAKQYMKSLKITIEEFLPSNHKQIVKTCVNNEHDTNQVIVNIANSVFSWTYHIVINVGVIHLYGFDITEQKQAENQLIHDALHDALTGLPNRTLFLDRLSSAVARGKRKDNYLFSVLFLDLDRFKIINDSLGHMFGDELLIQLSTRLKSSLRPGDTVARLGGDEFTILLDDIKDVTDATLVADRIKKELSLPFLLGEHEIFTTVSIGIALSSSGYNQPEDLLRNADMAMYRAKALGKSRHELFNNNMHQEVLASLKLETDLWKALEKKEFRVYYQPIILLESGKLSGFEALVRWEHPRRGFLSPKEFIPIAEETGLILQIDQWVLQAACKQAYEWQSNFKLNTPISISVNISGKHFTQTNFVEKIASMLQETKFDPRNLRLEITERMMMENTETVNTMLLKLKELNVQLQIDDFGTGYSSLSYLHRLPINALKIDHSFVSRIGSDRENSEIVKTIVMLAGNLGIDVIAEGIETNIQLEQLKLLNCKFGQGYLFYEPLTAEKAEALIFGEQKKYITSLG